MKITDRIVSCLRTNRNFICLSPTIGRVFLSIIFLALWLSSISSAVASEGKLICKSVPYSFKKTDLNLKKNLIRAKVVSWKSPTPAKATIICVHALGLSSHAYADFGQSMAMKGFNVYALDVRGFGICRNENGCDKLNLDRTVGDIKSLIELIQREDSANSDRVFLVGESMGGAVVLKAASLYPNLISGILVSAPAFKLYKLKRLTFKGLGDLVIPGTRPGPCAKSVMLQATSKQSLRNHWLKDTSNHKLALSFGEAISYYKFVRQTPKYSQGIKELPVCIMHGLQDNLAKPTGSAKLFNNINSKNKVFLVDCLGEHLLLEEKQLTSRILNFTVEWLKVQMNPHSAPAPVTKARHFIILKKQKNLNTINKKLLKKLKSLALLGIKKG